MRLLLTPESGSAILSSFRRISRVDRSCTRDCSSQKRRGVQLLKQDQFALVRALNVRTGILSERNE